MRVTARQPAPVRLRPGGGRGTGHDTRHQGLAVVPQIVRTTGDEGMEPGLELGAVQVPAGFGREEQAALAGRQDLLPYEEWPRAEEQLEAGDLPEGLRNLSRVLKQAGGLLLHATEWLDRNSPSRQSLRVEASRIGDAALQLDEVIEDIRKEYRG
ncbi:hypothetical protein [Streptomyces omiyaensis]|uniref:hypothetical protein n=1 Tax=Streptomyces omiyaensis TaxID=68247 RepID=UPI0036FBD5CC